MTQLPPIVSILIERFERNRESYKSQSYNETQLRHEFLDPFFEALGWDVANTQGHAEAYKDVIHEDAIKIGGYTKAPDYCFRIGGTRKFFLEAKKPAVNVRDEIPPAYQIRRYAWSAKVPNSTPKLPSALPCLWRTFFGRLMTPIRPRSASHPSGSASAIVISPVRCFLIGPAAAVIGM